MPILLLPGGSAPASFRGSPGARPGHAPGQARAGLGAPRAFLTQWSVYPYNRHLEEHWLIRETIYRRIRSVTEMRIDERRIERWLISWIKFRLTSRDIQTPRTFHPATCPNAAWSGAAARDRPIFGVLAEPL